MRLAGNAQFGSPNPEAPLPTKAQLLVSVRSVAEARAAIKGGCDILDVKDPSRGALGMADPLVAQSILREARARAFAGPLSLALGEAASWQTGPFCGLALPGGIAEMGTLYLKLGCADCQTPGRLARALREARNRANPANIASVVLVAVAYADWRLANACPPEVVARIAVSLGFGGLLIDTFEKTGGSLFDWLSLPRLQCLGRAARNASLLFALAGKLQIDHVPALRQAGAQVVGIRSAACRHGRRTAPIDARAVRAFKNRLLATANSRPSEEALAPSG